jgi:putative ABC transport system permease protein
VSDCDLTENNPIRLACAAVSSSFLPTFSIPPVLGRNFTREEDEPNAPHVALISYSFWQNRFGGNRGVVGGGAIQLDGRPTRIIGVLPSDFEYPTLAHTDVVLPQALDEGMVQRHEMGRVVRVFGRMKPGATVEQTKAVALRIIWRKSLSAIWRKLFTCLNSWSCQMKTESWRCLAFLCSNRILNRTGRFVL